MTGAGPPGPEPVRWGVVLGSLSIGLIAVVLSAAPATVLIGQDVRGPDDVSWDPVLVAALIALVGALVCRVLRGVASRRWLAEAVRTGRVSWSPVFAFTLVAWVLVVATGGLAWGTRVVAETAGAPIEPGSYRANLTKYPLPLLFLLAGLVVIGAAGYATLTYRRRHEFPVLAWHGVARLVEPPRKLPKAEAVKLRTRLWLQGVVIDALMFASGLLPQLLAGERPDESDLMKGVIGIIGGPGLTSFALLVMMLLLGWPSRRSALDALRQPSSLTAIGLTALGLAVEGTAGTIMAFAGVIIAAATCLNIMDRGSQPWLGFVYYAGSYVYGYFIGQDGDPTVPTGVTGWGMALLAAIYAAREARDHWRKWAALEPLRNS